MPETVLVLGNPASVFVQAPVRYWRARGIDARILTTRWDAPGVAGLPVVSAEAVVPAAVRAVIAATAPAFDHLDALIARHGVDRVKSALRTWGDSVGQPLLGAPLRDAPLLALAAAQLQACGVLGHEAFAYGTATSVAPAPRRALFAWGADVLHYAETSDAAFSMVRDALHGVRYVLVGSDTLKAHVSDRFALASDRVVVLDYGVDGSVFKRLTAAENARLRGESGIPAGARVVMNLRRYRTHWGAERVTGALLGLLGRRRDVYGLVVEGADGSIELDACLARAAEAGVRDRLVAVRGQVTPERVAELMGMADVAWSLVDSLEPVSLSVLQAAACGAQIVIADQDTYRQECARGLHATLLSDEGVEPVVEATCRLLDRPADAARTSAANLAYLAAHHDHGAAMDRLLHIVVGQATAARLLRLPAA